MGGDIFGLEVEDESSGIKIADTCRLLSPFIFVEKDCCSGWLDELRVLVYITDVTWRK
jgi:hypothetical protein